MPLPLNPLSHRIYCFPHLKLCLITMTHNFQVGENYIHTGYVQFESKHMPIQQILTKFLLEILLTI